MLVNIKYNSINYTANLKDPIDISIPIQQEGVVAWSMPRAVINPVNLDGWIGDTLKGAPVNFNNIFFNPHAHATHTECVGHISKEKESLNQELSTFFFIAKLITIAPKKRNKDCVITKHMIEKEINKSEILDAVIIRTLPNQEDKMCRNYSSTNPPYLLQNAADYLAELNVKHLLIDLPSVDKEKDGGQLNAHKAFWGVNNKKRHGCTITELIYVPDRVIDGLYLLNLQFVPFENDASPSRPVLFKLELLS